MILDRFRIDDKVAVVTGAGRGIGAAIALGFAEAGADVVIAARSEDQLTEVAAKIAELGRRAHVVVTDLSDPASSAALAQAAVDEFGRLDIVVNNVGGTMPGMLTDTTAEQLTAAFEFNVTTAHALVAAAVPHMLAQGGGAVVNITSTMGVFPGRGMAAYGTAKAALAHYTRLASFDLNPKIRVNAIAPGSIMTSALEFVAGNDEIRGALESGTPLRRIGEPEDIAAAALYLASPASAYVTGRVLQVDGGLIAPNFEMPVPDL